MSSGCLFIPPFYGILGSPYIYAAQDTSERERDEKDKAMLHLVEPNISKLTTPCLHSAVVVA
jgi:hypothetical protein